MANFATNKKLADNAAKGWIGDYVDQNLNRTALTQLSTTNKKTAGQQFAAIAQNGKNYYANKATKEDANTYGVSQVVALPSSAVKKQTTETKEGSNGTSSGSGSGSSSGSKVDTAPYIAQLNELYDRVMNRKPFQYDLNGDLLYRQMADQYTQLGQQAMRDTMGQAAALTGGYGNSYAQQVGNQAYQQYLSALNQQIPDLYDRAYNTYQDEADWLLQQYQMAATHPGYLEALTPQTSGGTANAQPTEATESTVGGSLDLATYLKYLTAMEKQSNNTTNPLANWYYKLLNS